MVPHNKHTQKSKRGRPPGRHIAKPKPVSPPPAASAPKPFRDLPRLDDLAAWSICEFCLANRMSRSFYYVLRREGLGPQETRLGAKVLISRQAASDWLIKREKQSVPA